MYKALSSSVYTENVNNDVDIIIIIISPIL